MQHAYLQLGATVLKGKVGVLGDSHTEDFWRSESMLLEPSDPFGLEVSSKASNRIPKQTQGGDL